MIVTFCGHRQIEHKESVHYWLERTIHELIQKGADVFYLGGYGAFDLMVADVVHHAKLCHPQIESILVLPYLNRPIDQNYYDDTLYPPLEKVPKSFAILKRNEWMIEKADIVVAYVLQDWGGAATALRYARNTKKTIIQFTMQTE